MKSDWSPDDSLFEADETGEIRGVRMIKDALRQQKVRFGKGVVTSKDPGMQAARAALTRDVGLAGVEQWLLPIVICSTDRPMLWLYTELAPGTRVPRHSHVNSHFRIVISGSFKTGNVALSQGDWMAVPAGVDYEMEVGDEKCVVMYPHPGPICDDLTE